MKKLCLQILPTLFILATILGLMAIIGDFLPPKVYAVAPPVHHVIAVNKMVSEGDQIFAQIPLLKRMCSCESWGDPNKEPREDNASGSLLLGYPNPNDVGACQIHVPAWGKIAAKLGYNIYTFDGNVEMAEYIFYTQGPPAWVASEGCWGVK